MRFLRARLLTLFCVIVTSAHANAPRRVTLELNTASPFSWVQPGYAGICMSFMDGTEVPSWTNSAMTTVPLDDPRFNSLVRSLAPAILRVGGGNEFRVVYEIDGGECAAANQTNPTWCLNMTRWAATLQWALDVDAKMVWSLGAQRRANGTSPLDFRAIGRFLEYTAGLPVPLRTAVYGFELGNELDGGDYESTTSVEPHTFAADYAQLRGLIDRHWADVERDARPRLVGPAQHPNVKFVRSFLGTLNALSASALDVFTFHDYVGIGIDPTLREKIMMPSYLESEWEGAAPTVRTAMALAPDAQIWMGEGSGAWHSGQCGVTDRVFGAFWYSSSLGRLARNGVEGFARHNFAGGCYSMINHTSADFGEQLPPTPNPDWWVAKLWHDTMGPDVLDLRALEGGDPHLQTYAHSGARFAPENSLGATLLFVNTSPDNSFALELPTFADAIMGHGLVWPRIEYVLTAPGGDLSAGYFLLNDAPLVWDASRPARLPGGRLVNESGVPLVVPPHSIVFVELPEAIVY